MTLRLISSARVREGDPYIYGISLARIGGCPSPLEGRRGYGMDVIVAAFPWAPQRFCGKFECRGRAVVKKSDPVHVDSDILGGTPVFVGTRVPLRNLIDYLEAGESIDAFLDDFPTVTKDQAVAVLEAAHKVLVSSARSAR